MPIMVTVGPMGSGKTTVITAMGVLAQQLDKVKLFSNYALSNIEYTYFHPTEFADLMNSEELNNAVILLDEAYLLMDSRSSGARINRLFSAFIYQARKRSVDVYIATHHPDHIDKRIRRAMNFRWRPRYNKSTNIIKVFSKDVQVGHMSTFQIYAPTFWPYFDTNELPPVPKKLTEIEF